MEHPIQITFRGLEPTEALTQAVEERASKLERFFDKIESCRIIVEAPHHHHHNGNVYHVRVRLAVPGEDRSLARSPSTPSTRISTWPSATP
jgi:ribosome-associated translation inhibitor RaiA